MLIEGILAALPTPFYSDERVYLRKLEANVARYSRSLLAGLLVLGSTGEAVALDEAESVEVLRSAAHACAPDKLLIAGIGQESLKRTLALAEAAASFGYDAVLVRTPVYYARQMTPEAVRTYFQTLADRSPLPLLLYHIPRCVPFEIPVDMVAELAQHPNILGIKESSGSIDRIKELVAVTRSAPLRLAQVTQQQRAVTRRMTLDSLVQGLRTRDVGFQVLTGSCSTLLESLQAGASGSVLGFAACAPQACFEVYLAWKDHDHALAEHNQQRIARPSRRIVEELGIAAVKHACDFNGYFGGRTRLPLLPISSNERQEVEQLLAQIRS